MIWNLSIFFQIKERYYKLQIHFSFNFLSNNQKIKFLIKILYKKIQLHTLNSEIPMVSYIIKNIIY